ncbi:MAG: peroxiredoxin family protein [Cyclobacteriaceae bacterium]
MKRSFGLLILSLIVIATGLVTSRCSFEDTTPIPMGELDSLNLLTLDSTEFTLTVADKRNSYLAVVFNPFCEHCQDEAVEIRNNISKLKDVTVLMISSETMAEVKKFSERYELNNFKNVKFLYASPVATYKVLNASYLPHMRLYDKDINPIEDFSTTTSVEKIMSKAKN